MNPRKVVVRILERFDSHPGDLAGMIEWRLAANPVDHRDRRFVFELVYGIVRHRLRLNYLIEHYLTDKRLTANAQLMRLLQLGLYQILYLDRVPDHAAVSETVDLAKAYRVTSRYAGVVNAILRKVIASRHRLPRPGPETEPAQRLSVEYSHPVWLVKRWLKQFGLANTRKLLEYDNRKPIVYLRRQLRGLARQQFEAEIRGLAEPAGGYNNLYYRLVRPVEAESIALLQQGLCTVQSPASGWVVALLGVGSGDYCLDMCSAPGGKTTLMAELAGAEGSVCACEINPRRLHKVRETVARMGLSAVYPIVCDSTSPPFEGHFDKVLIDAPCSGTGVIQRHPDARWTRTEEDISQAAAVQARLLDAGARLVGSNGTLVYATCSLEQEENQDQVEAFLRRHPEFTLQPAPSSIPSGIVTVEGYLRIRPFEDSMDGMFAARLTRT